MASTLLAHEHRVDEALAAVRRGVVNGAVMMPARFTLAGEAEARASPTRSGRTSKPTATGSGYGRSLTTFNAADSSMTPWNEAPDWSCDTSSEQASRLLDCWEEHPGRVHTSTLAAVAAGIRDAGRRLGDRAAQDHADRLTRRLLGGEFTLADAFVRSPAIRGSTGRCCG